MKSPAGVSTPFVYNAHDELVNTGGESFGDVGTHGRRAKRRLARAATGRSPRTDHPIPANPRSRKPGERIVAIENFEPRLAQLSLDNARRNVMFFDLLFARFVEKAVADRVCSGSSASTRSWVI